MRDEDVINVTMTVVDLKKESFTLTYTQDVTVYLNEKEDSSWKRNASDGEDVGK